MSDIDHLLERARNTVYAANRDQSLYGGWGIITELADALAAAQEAVAIVEAINTLLENGRTKVSIGPGVDYDIKAVANDKVRDWSWTRYANTLREALEACVAARDQHDRERKDT